MRISPILPVVALALGAVSPLSAQQAAAPAPKNFIGNGGFESSFRRENLWDGVDNAGYLAGERGTVPILTTSGAITDSAMPFSVGVADMNNDGRLDLVTMDVLGYLRIYFNEGTREEPKFSTGDLGGIFLGRIAPNDPLLGGVPAPWARLGPRLFPTNALGTGKVDLVVGNYLGEILFIPNGGSNQAPDFKQPQDVGKMAIPTMKDPTKRWGNVFAPVLFDWNKDGKPDLILGEGSYSANNIHLLINQSGGLRPTFDETQRTVLAFGDGLEQLNPTVVDYNGDNLPDLLVAERTGKIAVYLNKGNQGKIGELPPDLPFASFVPGASGSAPLSIGGICTITTGDMNGDGLFDIVVGKINGRVAMLLNTGSKTEPKFAAPVELKGEPNTPPMMIPSGWDVDFGLKRGNFLAYASVVKAADDPKAEPAEGQACLKVGYYPPANKVMPPPTTYTSAYPGFFVGEPNFYHTSEDLLSNAPARYFMLRQLGRFKLNNNKNYTLSFKIKGRASEGKVIIGWTGYKRLSESRAVVGEREAARVTRNEVEERGSESVTFNPGAAWTEVKKDFRVQFKTKELLDAQTTTTTVLQVTFAMPQGGEVYFDDFKIVERP